MAPFKAGDKVRRIRNNRIEIIESCFWCDNCRQWEVDTNFNHLVPAKYYTLITRSGHKLTAIFK